MVFYRLNYGLEGRAHTTDLDIAAPTVTEGMAKFSLFLVLEVAISITGRTTPGAVSFNSEAPGVCLSYGCAAVSLFPTPIIIIYLKPVQEHSEKMATYGWLMKAAKDSKRTTSTSGSNETEEK